MRFSRVLVGEFQVVPQDCNICMPHQFSQGVQIHPSPQHGKSKPAPEVMQGGRFYFGLL